MCSAFDRFIVNEAKLGRRVQLDALRQLSAQKTSRAPQALACLRNVRWIEAGKVYRCVSTVWRDFDASERDHADPRVAQLPMQNLGKLPLNLIPDLLGASALSNHARSSERAGDFHHLEDFKLITFFQIIEVLQ
jgi:hypothetical protein